MTLWKLKTTLRCLLGHAWVIHQHNIRSDEQGRDGREFIFVIAFKVCNRCAKSKLIHLLE